MRTRVRMAVLRVQVVALVLLLAPMRPSVAHLYGQPGPSLDEPVIIVEDADVCFRRVLAGGRLHEQLIRRSLPADHVDRCRHACKVEDHFTCEGFNYRPGVGSCELTAVPLPLLEPHRDSRADRDYDYFARDRNAQPPHCPADDLYGPGPMWGPGWGGGAAVGGGQQGAVQGTAWASSGPGSSSAAGWGSGNALGTGYGPGYAPGYASGYAPAPSPGTAGHNGEVGFYGGSASGGAGTHRNDYNYISNEVDHHYGGVKPGKHMYDGYGLLGGGNALPGNQQWNYGGGYGASYGGSYGGTYGGSYGGTYGGSHGGQGGGYPPNFITPPPPPAPLGPVLPPPPPPPGAAPPPIGHPPIGDGCFVRAHGGYRIADRLVSATLATTSLPQCERECHSSTRVRCNAFAFRYNSWPYNCDLSEVALPQVDTFTELVPDRNADVFGREPRCAPAPAGWDHDAECFERVRSGQRLAPNAVKDLLHAHGLGACQTACLSATTYVCRAFTFRFGPPGPDGPPENCLLSDWPSDEILPWKDTLPDPGTEMYQRSSFGRGCELWRRAWPGAGGVGGGGAGADPARPTVRDQYCYAGYGGPARLLPSAVLRPLRVPTELDCKAECSRMFEAGDVACSALSFRSEEAAVPVPGPNCFLSELAMRDLRPGLDLVRDPAHWLFAWNEDDPRCFRGYPRGPNQGRHRYPALPGRGGDEDLWGREEQAGVWRRFSVSGQACRSLCAPHPVGFWSCALESGGWDYCCRPGHSCGYSEGYSYPWCYVGSAALDQWRPCSERYRPYPGGDQDARYWPVSYLHPAPPPNGTAPGQGGQGGQGYPPRGGGGSGGGSGGGYGGGSSTTTTRPKDLQYPAVPRHRPGFTPAPDDGGDDSNRWMPSVTNLPSRTSKFILNHPEYYNYVRLNGNGPSSNGTVRHPPASGAGKDCQDASKTGTEPPPPTSTARPGQSGNQSNVVVIGGKDKNKDGSNNNSQLDDDDDFLSAAAAIVRTNTPASPTSRPPKEQFTAASERPQDSEEDDDEPLELEVVDAVDSAGTMASRNGTVSVSGRVGTGKPEQDKAQGRADDDSSDQEDAEESRWLERVALVERVDPKLGLSLGEAPKKAKVTLFRRERRAG